MRKKNNICIVTASLMIGGGDKLIYSICSYLVKDDFNIYLFPSYPTPRKTSSTKNMFTSIGVNVDEISIYDIFYSKMIWTFQMIIEMSSKIYSDPKIVFSLKKLIMSLKISNKNASKNVNRYFNEIVRSKISAYNHEHKIHLLLGFHTVTCETLYNLKKELMIPTIYTEITSPKAIYEDNLNTLPTLREQIDAYASFDKIYVPSHAIEKELMHYYNISNNVSVMPFIDVFPRPPHSLNMSNKKIAKYGLMSRFSKEKNQAILIKMLPNILKYVPDAELVLIGEGPDEKYLKELAIQYGVRNCVKFMPPYKSISDVIDLIDIVVLLSDYEGMPLTLIEALYYGKPIIATDVGSISEIVINGVNGYIVNKNDYNLIIHQIVSLMTDPQKYALFSKNSIDLYNQKFNPDMLYQQFIHDIYPLINF